MRKIMLVFTLLIIAKATSQESTTVSEFQTKILGSWEGQGTLFGQDAAFEMQWKSLFQGKFLQLKFKNQFKDKSNAIREMQALGNYSIRAGKGQWIDSRGVMLPLQLSVYEDSMEVIWGDSQSEKGKTIYTLLDKNQVEVKDYVIKAKDTIPFGTAKYRRIKH